MSMGPEPAARAIGAPQISEPASNPKIPMDVTSWRGRTLTAVDPRFILSSLCDQLPVDARLGDTPPPGNLQTTEISTAISADRVNRMDQPFSWRKANVAAAAYSPRSLSSRW